MNIPITVTETSGLKRTRAPVEVGIPLARGQATTQNHWVVLDEKGKALPSQFKPLIEYNDGSLRALHGVFLADIGPKKSRTLTVSMSESPAFVPMIIEDEKGFSVSTGALRVLFNKQGEITSLVYNNREALVTDAGASLQLLLALGYSGFFTPFISAAVAVIKENGPVRAILNLRGQLEFKDDRGPLVLALDADYVFYRHRAEIHVAPMLLGAVTDNCTLSGWSLRFNLRNGKKLTYGTSPELVRQDPNHENMTWRSLAQGWVSWKTAGRASLTAWSPDFTRHQNGLVRTYVTDQERNNLKIDFGRVESTWGYQDVHQPARPIMVKRGGWRRWEAVFGLHNTADQPSKHVQAWAHPLRAFVTPDKYFQALGIWLEGKENNSPLRKKVADKCAEFVSREPEYVGSLHGGWDGPNRLYLERGVSRGDFGEYLFNEFYRTAEPRFYRMGFDFGQIYRDGFCFTIPEASHGKNELGGARARWSEFYVCAIRSYRGAGLLAYMYQETGDERYLEALRQRAAFHLANYPHNAGRQSMGNHDSAFLADYLAMPSLLEKAREVARDSLDRHFDPQNGFFEDYDLSRTLPDGRRPAAPIKAGMWFMRDFLYTSNASTEMTAYNIIGWYGLYRMRGVDDAMKEKIYAVCKWFRDKQNKDGSWPYPHVDSKTRWGHGCLQDALAMLQAYKMFNDTSFLASAERSLKFAERLFKKYGRIPLLLDILPHEKTEDSLTYYYGIEALAVYNEILCSTDKNRWRLVSISGKGSDNGKSKKR